MPKPKCVMLENMLEAAGNSGAPMPIDIIRLPEHPGMALLVYPNGVGLMVAENENKCIIGTAILRPPAMEQIMPQLQSW